MATKKVKKKKSSNPNKGINALDNIKINNPDPGETKSQTDKQIADANAAGESFADKYIDPEAFRHVSEERTQEETDILSMLKAEVERSSQRTPDAQLALDKFRDALSGLDSQENSALKETARRQLDSQYQTQMAQAKVGAARSGTRGGAANAQSSVLERDRARAQQGLESDLVAQNVGVKQNALSNFGGFVNSLDTSEAARRQGAQGTFASQANNQVERDLSKQQFNIGTDQEAAGARLQAILGGAGVYSSTYGNNLSNNLATQNLQATLGLQQEQLRQSESANKAYADSLKAYNQKAGTPTLTTTKKSVVTNKTNTRK